MQEALNQKIDAFIAANKEQILKDIATLVSINSVEENHIGYAELAGADAEKYLATICHVDVVPEGNGWTEDPFKMEIRDGWMIGRGVADDKGPMVATLYALKFLKEEGVSLRYPGPCVLLHPGRRVPGLQRREGPLRRQAGQPRVQRRHQGLRGRRRHQRCA